MPKEIVDLNELDRILPKTKEVRVKRKKDIVKVKFRTNKYLYTIKLTEKEADALLEKIKETEIKVVYF
ncbi:MAG: 50S ribosomal protein L38e [Candidatus Njordarchaeales archaeon]